MIRLPDLKADKLGNASIQKTCPDDPGVTVWIQALDVEAGVLSNGLKEQIQ